MEAFSPHKFKFKTIFINFYHLIRIWFIPCKENSMKNNNIHISWKSYNIIHLWQLERFLAKWCVMWSEITIGLFNCLKLVLDLNNDISWLIFFDFVEQMYNFTVRTVNDANDSTSEPSQPIACKTKAGGKNLTLFCSDFSA